MKTTLLTFFASLLLLNVSAQQMRVKKPNFNSFNSDKKISTELLNKLSLSETKRHPEYGTLPFNAQCIECAEMIEKRTIDSRFFIDPKSIGHTYSQKSYFPLHYKKNENDIWRTIDFRLRPDANHPNVFVANDQPCPTKIDLNKHSTSITDRGFEFEYNKNLSLYFFDEDNAYTQAMSANYTTQHIGEEGLEVVNMWNGINMEATCRAGEIKTNFVVNAPLQIPISKGWMVIEDHFSLPVGYSLVESKKGERDGKFFGGDYLVVDEQGRTCITYERPSFVDAMAWGVKGNYQVEKNNNDYTLKLFVPVSWLTRNDNTYPLSIDPTVSGVTKKGDFLSTPGGFTESMGFTTQPASCDYHMSVLVPGKSTLTNAFVDLEYRLQFDPACGTTPLPIPFCTFSQVYQQVVCNACGTTTGNLVCNPATAPFTGTCTTDSNLVPGANAILINSLVPNYLSCYTPQCQDYIVDFTLKNSDSTCQDVCGWLCAMGYMWQMTVEAQQVDNNITSSVSSPICLNDSAVITSHATGGVPPYHYVWTTDGGNTFDTIYNSPDFILHPQQTTYIVCQTLDSCNFPSSISNELVVAINNTSAIIFSGDTLFAPIGIFYQWYEDTVAIAGANSSCYIPTHSGNYTVFVTDTSGCLLTPSTFYNIACLAYFEIFQDSITEGYYYGYNLSSGSSLTYLWDFGDSTTSTDAYPSHVYAQNGQYFVCLTVTGTDSCTNTYCDSSFYVFKTESGLMSHLNILSPTGVQDISNDSKISVYPNPATNQLFIDAHGATVKSVLLYGIDGKLMKEIKQLPENGIDISHLSKGVYIAEIRTKDFSVKRRWVKI